MLIEETYIKGCFVLKPKVHKDERGQFSELFNQKEFNQIIGRQYNFVQDNQSLSKKGVLRGLHFQTANIQGKLVRVSKGSIFDVAVDLRQNSPTFGKWFGIELSFNNQLQLWIPPGFAHGFLSLQENTIVSYKCTDYYNPKSEKCIFYNDSYLSINWPSGYDLTVSKKDLDGEKFSDLLAL
jgi:dTDP-4-dehydrorhamnose 3,5-epimerase